jgi:hypothetical protein
VNNINTLQNGAVGNQGDEWDVADDQQVSLFNIAQRNILHLFDFNSSSFTFCLYVSVLYVCCNCYIFLKLCRNL